MERNNTALTGIKMMIADGIVTQEAAEKYFPELKESEDEKILRVLKEGFEIYNKGEWYGGITNEQILAWLEKQGEQKETPCDKCKKEQPSHSCQDITEFGRCAVEHEQKPADKVEPKFHKGDIVVDKGGRIFKITRIDKDYNGITYACRLTENPIFWFLYYEDEIRLWDITKDAKDGDVLVTGGVIFIFNKIHGVWLNCHCSLHKDGSFNNGDYDLITDKYFSEVYPATKEQRDTLMKAMADTGYTFDFEKKELKKIKTIDEYEGLTDFERTVADVCIGFIGKELGWKQYVKDNAENLLKIAVKKFNAVQPKQEWNDEDEKEVAVLEAYIRSKDWSERHIDRALGIVDELVNKAKSLKSQPKQEWSVEDEDMLDNIIDDYDDADEHNLVDDIGKVMWLKSLKERVACEANCTTAKQWKPSEEQIAELEFFISDLPKCSVVAQKIIKKGKDTLVSLLSDLKKLREE